MKTKQNSNSLLPFPRLRIMERKSTRIFFLMIAAVFTLNTALLVMTTQFRGSGYQRRLDSFEQEKVAEQKLVSPQKLTYIDEEETKTLKERQLEKVPPIFSVDAEKIYSRIALYEQFASFLKKGLPDSNSGSLHDTVTARFPVNPSEEVCALLSDTEDLNKILPVTETILRGQLQKGIIESVPKKDGQEPEIIELRRWEEGEKVHILIKKEQWRTSEKVSDNIGNVVETYSLSGENEQIVTGLVRTFLTPTAFYNSALTEAKKNSVAESMEPVTHTIDEGEVIVNEGEIVTATDMQRIRALRSSFPKPDTTESLAILLYLVFVFILGFILLVPLLRRTRRVMQHTIILLSSSILFTFNLFLVERVALIPEAIPVSLGLSTAFLSMMVSILITERIGVILALLLSLSIFAVPSVGIHAFLFSFFAGVTGIYAIENSEKRIDIVTGTIKLTGVVLPLLFVIGLLQEEGPSWFLSAAGFGILHSFGTGGLILALLPALEHVLNAPTVFRLRELSDINTPIFRRMITVAPGTYSHSMSVAHLAESATREVGANHLLARVGAYYHDIGKMEQPEYFIENQQDRNRHDEMTPSLSVAVIKSHIKLGKEKAKELKLPPEVVEIVADHHGNDVISYFYSRALQNNEGDEKTISPKDFSYNGSPPRSKEAAIVMLADVIEAQSRTLQKPTVKKFDKMVWDAIMRKITNKQLSRSTLSFQDLELIKNSFVMFLAGQFHNRIEYPETKEAVE